MDAIVESTSNLSIFVGLFSPACFAESDSSHFSSVTFDYVWDLTPL